MTANSPSANQHRECEQPAMLFSPDPHDVFISYAREDSEWVQQHLYEPLRRCRTAGGRPPRIFFDVGEHGVQIGQNFLHAIANAIHVAKKIVPVYSRSYFHKKMCQYELDLAFNRDVSGQTSILLPILIDPGALTDVPYAVSLVNFWPISDRDWFEKLRQALELQQSAEELTLTFLDQPGDVFANHTLPVVRVAVNCGGLPVAYPEEVTLRAEQGQLLGTNIVKTEQGVAAFDDLSIADAVGLTRLFARSSASGESASQPFSVFSRTSLERRPAPPVERPEQVTIPAAGEVIFFSMGRHLAVIQSQRILLYGVDGRPVTAEPLPLRAPIRVIRRRAKRLVLADWLGNLYAIGDDGRHREWRFGESEGGFVVPADVDLTDGQILVGFWSGSVFSLEDSGRAELVLKDPAGIQALGVYGQRLFTCDFSGNLRVYHHRKLVNTSTVEPTIWLLKETPTGLVAVGERKFYHISQDGARVIDFDMPLSGITSVYELSDLPIVIDADGKGIRFDANLVISSTVYTHPGAEPVSADDAGNYCVFRNPDGTRTLLVRDRIVFSHRGGCLAVSPKGDYFALGDQSSIRLYSEAEFRSLILSEQQEAGFRVDGERLSR